jgi:hypothetical protein
VPSGITKHTWANQRINGDVEILGTLSANETTLDELKDSGGNTIVKSDGSGHISELARIDAVTQSIEDSFVVTVPIAMLVSFKQSGWIVEATGDWDASGSNDILYCWLNSVIPYQHLKGTVVLDEITVSFISYDNDNNYITSVQLQKVDRSASVTNVFTDSDDQGKGDTAHHDVTYQVNETIVADCMYRFDISVVANVNNIRIYCLQLKWHLAEV